MYIIAVLRFAFVFRGVLLLLLLMDIFLEADLEWDLRLRLGVYLLPIIKPFYFYSFGDSLTGFYSKDDVEKRGCLKASSQLMRSPSLILRHFLMKSLLRAEILASNGIVFVIMFFRSYN